MIDHLRQKLGWNRDDVRTRESRILDVHDSANAAYDDVRGNLPVVEPAARVANRHSWIVAFVSDAACENAHISGTRFCGEHRLIEGGGGGRVDADAFLREAVHHTEAGFTMFIDDRNFYYDVAGPSGERASLFDHHFAVIGSHFDPKGLPPEHGGEMASAILEIGRAVFKHDAGVRGNAVDDTLFEPIGNLFLICRIYEHSHGSSLQKKRLNCAEARSTKQH